MPDWKLAFVLMILLLAVSVASAAEIGDSITLTSSKVWVVANNVDTATITAHVTNTTPIVHDVSGAIVTFVVDDPVYGTFLTATATTDINGLATSTFKVWNKSGTAPLRGSVDAQTVILNQNVDHDSPYTVTYTYNGEVIVNMTTPLSATLKDKWGNLVDDRRVAETVHFAIGSPLGGAGFWNGAAYVDDITLTVNGAGTVSTSCKVDTLAGDNIVWMEHLGSIPDKYFTIVGISEGIPQSMTTEITPTAFPNPYVAADGTSVFYLKYTLFDIFGNPAGNRTVWVNTSIGENHLLRSNSMGEILATYGPKDTTATITINATVVDNPAVTSTLVVEFVSTAPTNIILTANPETMPSHDVAPAYTANVMAKVMDIKGNPVAGESVTFTLGAVTYEGLYNITSAPLLLSGLAVTDANGYATVPFQPGGFITDKTALNYSATATGHAVVTAAWNGTSKSMTLSWKNYPYLSVETVVVPSTVAVNDTVDVTIRLKGDGWALQPDPIDVVLVTDVSGSMGGAKITDAKNAGKIFAAQMGAQDRVGLESYGWNAPNPWTAKAKDDLPLSFDKSTVNATINTYAAIGNTPMRPAIFNATMMIKNDPRAGAVKAMVLLTDGQWNYCGDPRGISNAYPRQIQKNGADLVNPTESVVTHAQNNGVKMFTVGLGAGANGAELSAYATQTGGKYYFAPNSSQLAQIYTDIAGELKTSAGVNTTMTTDFQNVQVNNVTLPGGNVFQYVYLNGVSTKITWPNGTVMTLDQTADWNLDHKLDFNVGTVKLNETWEGTFRLRVLKDGNIDVFGNSSTIQFEGSVGPSTLTLPHTFITAIPNLNNTGMNQTALDISNLHCTKAGVITDFIPVEWTIAYSGNYTVTEKVSYSSDGGHTWTLFDTNYITSATMTDYSNLDVRSLPAGDYLIRVDASAPDAPNDRETLLAPVTVGSQGRAYIKLE